MLEVAGAVAQLGLTAGFVILALSVLVSTAIEAWRGPRQ